MNIITYCDICEHNIISRFKRHLNTTKHKLIQLLKEHNKIIHNFFCVFLFFWCFGLEIKCYIIII